MAEPVALIDKDVQVALTLASVGYVGEGTPDKKTLMQGTLDKNPDLPTAAAWTIIWGPAECNDNFALWYIAEGRDASGAPTLAVVIRGTEMAKFGSKILDAEVVMVDLPFWDQFPPSGVKIAMGFRNEFVGLMKARDPDTGTDGISFLVDFVERSTERYEIHVIGHSLGGATAPLMAIRLQHLFRALGVRSFPFGGQSTGNQVFAQWYARTFPNQPSCWVNRLDITPMMFADMDQLEASWAGGPTCSPLLKDFIKLLRPLLRDYAPLPVPLYYEGRLYPTDPKDKDPWYTEASHQHQHLYYMLMSGVPLDVINRAFTPKLVPPPGT